MVGSKKSFITLLTIILFVYADLICENVLVIVNDHQTHIVATSLLLVFLLFQIFFAAIQSGLSDFIGRKESLVLSFSVSLFSLLCAFLYSFNCLRWEFFLILALISKAFWGNTIPISFAAIADTQKKNYRGSFALASSTYSLAFITLIIINSFFSDELIFISISAAIILTSLLMCISSFRDSSDKSAHLPHDGSLTHPSNFFIKAWNLGVREISLLITELKRPLTKYALSAYTLWEVSMYSIIISQVDLNPGPSQKITLAMMIGYLIGVFILRVRPCSRLKDKKMITIGYFFSFFSLIPYFILMKFTTSQNILLGACYSLHAIGNAFLSPTILSILVRKRSTHDQGKILGLVESADTVAFLLATIFVMAYSGYSWPVMVLVLFSFISFSLSWFYFPVIKRLEKNIYKQN